MKTITFNFNNSSAYIFPDDTTLIASAENITTPTFIIGDMNSGNTTIHTGVTPPENWQGNRYSFDGTTWSEVAGWVDHKVAEIARLRLEIDALNA